jgi:hypothetical protein
MMERLGDERCGLYFLAGVDTKTVNRPGMLIIHAAQGGAITREHEHFIETAFGGEIDPDLEVRICYHSSRDLYAPDSLESFAKLFEHDHIVADPTGAFARVSKLLRVRLRMHFSG